MRRTAITSAVLLGALAGAGVRGGDFASEVVEYRPAPGQFINGPVHHDPSDALGAPIGGGLSAPDNSKVVSLGGFGGSITLRFAHTVLDDPCNPFGLDAIVFANSFWSGGNPSNPSREPGVIEISLDANANGLADDPWFVIAGTLLPAIPDDAAAMRQWDNDPGSPTPPADTSWYPDDSIHDFVPPGFPSSYATSGWLLASGSLVVGHADASPVLLLGDQDADDAVDDPGADPAGFYTRPDNPWASGVTPGSGGGDAFDIAWAVDPATGEPARLPGFDFIRLSTGRDALMPPLGEVSTEVGGVSDVRGDALFFDVDSSGTTDAEDLYAWHGSPTDLSGEGAIDAHDARMLAACARAGEPQDVEANR